MNAQDQLNSIVVSMSGRFKPTMGSGPMFHPQAQAFDVKPWLAEPTPRPKLLLGHKGQAHDGSQHLMVLWATSDCIIFMEEVNGPQAMLALPYGGHGQAITVATDTAEGQEFIDKALDYMLASKPVHKLATTTKEAFLNQLRAAGISMSQAPALPAS